MGLAILANALWATVETSQNNVSEVFPRQPFSGLPSRPGPRDAYHATPTTDQSKQLQPPYPEVRL